MTKRFVFVFIALSLVTAACGGSDTSTDDTQAAPTTASTDAQDAPETATETTAAPSGESSTAGASGKATLTLDNGETFDFSILCALESQEAAGQEILFTLVSYDKPYNLDVTQFGENSFGGAANITMYDADTYDTVWDATTLYGSDVTLSLNGNTITGSGVFFENGEPGGVEMRGELEATC